jgi:hypothetical protein
MSDSNPLFALCFKLLSSMLSQPFQYFGIWLLICFILQGIFAYGISKKLFVFQDQRLCSTVLFIFAPIFLGRFAALERFHLTLAGQWEVLAAIFIYLSPQASRRNLWWTVLVGIGVLTNPYLLVMIMVIWLADIFRTLRMRQTQPACVYLNAGLVIGAALVVALASGVYAFPDLGAPSLSQALNSTSQGQPGLYKFNLVSPFDSEGWSYFLPRRANPGPGEYEGYSYLGAGLIFLLACAIVIAIKRPHTVLVGREHYPLAIFLFGLVFFAASPLVSVGKITISMPWPNALLLVGNVFRSTGRFVWPVFYMAVVFMLRVLARTRNPRFLTSILIIAATLQVADTSAGWGHFATSVAKDGSEWPSPMRSPVWKELARRYRTIRQAVPARYYTSTSRDVSYFALKNGLGTDAVYLARVNASGFAALSARAAESRRTGVFGTDSIWLLDRATFLMLRPRSACRGDFVANVDGYLILAPRYLPSNVAVC